jgi:hypothetical protein
MTDVPGLYFLGLSWQHTRGSALLGWVKDDAEFIAEQIDALAELQTAPERETTESQSVRASQAAPLKTPPVPVA